MIFRKLLDVVSSIKYQYLYFCRLCDILATRKKILGKLERGANPNMIDLVDDYEIKECKEFEKKFQTG